ncbi:MAG TPA: OmcA/MtrC family decaheme c-type cytochrome, partial [Sulfuricaulis sp.]
MKNRTAFGGFTFLVVASALTLVLAGCSGNEGAPGTPGPGVTSPGAATALNITVTSASVSSAPVMKFTVTNQDNSKVAGLTLSDLRFTIAKLVPGSNGGPSKWQNYINTQSSGLAVGFVRGNRESNGTLVDHQDGTYTYTFSTDITDPTKTCIAPCVDADGNPIDTSYNASLTHRVAVQTRGALPMVNGVYTFRPSDGATTGLFSREIVKTESCNECHNKLELHDARIETQYCVMCHNPGSTGKGTVGTVTGPTTVDFKVMIHKIHNGADLASVTSGGDYGIFGYSGTILSFKDVHFPQDIRNCTKCHDGAKTAQGDNWKNQPSKAACGACHDAVYFGTSPDPAKAYQTESHIAKAAAHVPPVTVGPDPADDTCIACHSASGPAGSIEAAHE